MNIEELREYCLSMGEVTEKTPFGNFARRFDSILVFYIMGHMFCLADMEDFTSVTVKAHPEVIEELKMTRSSVSSHRNMSSGIGSSSASTAMCPTARSIVSSKVRMR